MCDHCDRVASDYGKGSLIHHAVERYLHPLTPEQIAARDAYAQQMADCIAGWESDADEES